MLRYVGALEAQVESAVAFIRDVARVTPHENMAWDNEIADRNEKGLTQIVKVTYEVGEQSFLSQKRCRNRI
jgi:hypothetical protein